MAPLYALAARPLLAREAVAAEAVGMALPPTIGASPWLASPKWNDEDFWSLGQVAADLGVPPADLLAVLFAESALDPAAVNRGADGFPVAVGLNQITGILNSALGISEAQRQTMPLWPVREQLPYVRKSFLVSGVKGYALPDAGALYLMNFAPGRASQGFGGDVVLYDSTKHPKEYAANKGADREKKGWISLENMRQMLRSSVASSAFQAALARYQGVTGDTSPPRILSPTGAAPPAPPAPPTPGGGGAGDSSVDGTTLALAAIGLGAAVVALRG